MTIQEALALAQALGFSHVGELNVGALECLPEVRQMCAADRCHHYGRSWSCPPHCGSLEEISQRMARYHGGILVQSTGALEDDFDIETMQETETLQKERFRQLVAQVRALAPDCLPMAAGTCTVCERCTCPDAPCRCPELAIPSMEACGLFVSRVCEQSNLPYYYGPQTITYTSCILLD
jgi:predicted metal-binding protein